MLKTSLSCSQPIDVSNVQKIVKFASFLTIKLLRLFQQKLLTMLIKWCFNQFENSLLMVNIRKIWIINHFNNYTCIYK